MFCSLEMHCPNRTDVDYCYSFLDSCIARNGNHSGGGRGGCRGVDLTSLLSLCLMTVAPILIGSTTATATIWENDTTAEEGDWSSANGTGDGSWLLSQNNLFVGVVLEAVAMPM
mmetsp:Transcript_2151/g.5052  ORF Transcript_2151/g.5052 Transcript_2151/m.5052 type:complete len:114 (+) Transcript_2151:785-1126(+)